MQYVSLVSNNLTILLLEAVIVLLYVFSVLYQILLIDMFREKGNRSSLPSINDGLDLGPSKYHWHLRCPYLLLIRIV